MSRIFKSVVAINLFTLLLVGICFLTNYRGGGLLFFPVLMPVLWVLWLAYAVCEREMNPWKLTFLWALIDITVLCVVGLLMNSVHGLAVRNDTEYLFVIVFTPVILPVILVSAFVPAIGAWLAAIASGTSYLLPPGGLLSDWVGCSTMSAISSCLFVSLLHCWKIVKRRSDKPNYAKTGEDKDRNPQ